MVSEFSCIVDLNQARIDRSKKRTLQYSLTMKTKLSIPIFYGTQAVLFKTLLMICATISRMYCILFPLSIWNIKIQIDPLK